MKSVTIIGNNAGNQPLSDGGRIKTRLYKNILEKEGFFVNFIDIFGWKKKIFKIVFAIKKAVKKSGKIIIMAGPRGCRFFIPLVHFLDFKHKCKLVFCPLGVGTIDKLIKDLNPQEVDCFIKNENYFGKKDKKMSKILKDFEYVVLQNSVLEACYKQFYNLTNTAVLRNFRLENQQIEQTSNNRTDYLNVIFYSRVCENKGILDLVEAVKKCNADNFKINLDIVGDNQLEDKNYFNNLNLPFVEYKGVIKQEESIKLLSNYDLFCLPTKYHGEGTPGSLIESLFAGTPVLVSSYSQANEIVVDGENGFIFEINNIESLIEKLIYCYRNKGKLGLMRKKVIDSSKTFTYDYNASDFLRYFGDK